MLSAVDFYDYPVELSEEEIKNATSISITDEKRNIYRLAHEYVYDVVIYPTFNEDIKKRIILKYHDLLEKPIKRALLAQFLYLYENGDVGNWNGMIQSGESDVADKEAQSIITKMISPKVVNILKGAPIDILYAGG